MNRTNTKKMEEAQTMRRAGASCSQSVAAPFAADAGISKKAVMALSLPFAGGMARGATCGALTGAYIAAGLLVGGNSEDDAVNRAASVKAVTELNAIFEERFGDLTCKGMLNCDPATPEGAERMKAENLKEKICMPAILACVEYLERLQR